MSTRENCVSNELMQGMLQLIKSKAVFVAYSKNLNTSCIRFKSEASSVSFLPVSMRLSLRNILRNALRKTCKYDYLNCHFCYLFSSFLFITLMLNLKGRQVKLYSWYENWKHVALQLPWWTVVLQHSLMFLSLSVCGLYHLVVKFGITSLVRSQVSHQNVLRLFWIGPTLLSNSLKSIFCSYSSYACAHVDIQQNTYFFFLFVFQGKDSTTTITLSPSTTPPVSLAASSISPPPS